MQKSTKTGFNWSFSYRNTASRLGVIRARCDGLNFHPHLAAWETYTIANRQDYYTLGARQSNVVTHSTVSLRLARGLIHIRS
jgi:hypothetical protein